MNHSAEDPRRSPRAKVFLAAALECDSGTIPVTLRDLSETGALVEGANPLSEDLEVWLCRNELRVHGHVAWTRDKFAGIAFSRELNPEVVLRHISRPQPRTPDETIHRRPALTRPGMSPEEQRWAEELTREPLRRSRRN